MDIFYFINSSNFLNLIFCEVGVKTMERQLEQSKRQTRYAWAKYYEAKEESHITSITRVEYIDTLPEFVKAELVDMYKELRKEIECPVCLEVIDIGVLKFTKCGHKYCEDCLSRLSDCAVCRKKLK